VVDEQVLGGDWEGAQPVRAQEEHHGVWEGVEGEVRPGLRRGPLPTPGEGKSGPRVAAAEGPVVW